MARKVGSWTTKSGVPATHHHQLRTRPVLVAWSSRRRRCTQYKGSIVKEEIVVLLFVCGFIMSALAEIRVSQGFQVRGIICSLFFLVMVRSHNSNSSYCLVYKHHYHYGSVNLSEIDLLGISIFFLRCRALYSVFCSMLSPAVEEVTSVLRGATR